MPRVNREVREQTVPRQWDTVAIVGVGLIGGSIGLALKRRRLARQVVGIGRRRSSLERARRVGAVDATTLSLPRAISQAELVVFCTPVDTIVEQLPRAAAKASPDTVMTDAGSTKQWIVARLEDALENGGAAFVGSHPLAGSENRGVSAARTDLFEDRVCVVTPTPRTPRKALATVRRFWRALGARVVEMTPQAHDRALARTSHLPHLVAAALASSLPDAYRHLAASGFRDTTRIAAGDPELWTGICRQNRSSLLEAIKEFEHELGKLRRALTDDDMKTLARLLECAKRKRDQLGVNESC